MALGLSWMAAASGLERMTSPPALPDPATLRRPAGRLPRLVPPAPEDRPEGRDCAVSVHPMEPAEHAGMGRCDRRVWVTWKATPGARYQVLQSPFASWQPWPVWTGPADRVNMAYSAPIPEGQPSGVYRVIPIP